LVFKKPEIETSEVYGLNRSQTKFRLQGTFTFADGDGDVRLGPQSKANLRLIAERPSGRWIITVADDSGSSLSFLNKPGSTSGTIRFDFTILVSAKVTDDFTVWFTLFDATGNASNTLKAKATEWYF
jgi:hypothetical protein